MGVIGDRSGRLVISSHQGPEAKQQRADLWQGHKQVVTPVVNRPVVSKSSLTTCTRLCGKWSNYTARKILPLLRRWIGIKISPNYHFTIVLPRSFPSQSYKWGVSISFCSEGVQSLSPGKSSSCTDPALHFQRGFLI